MIPSKPVSKAVSFGFHAGEEVRLLLPDNPVLHLRTGVIKSVTEWGAHVATTAAATGMFRALFSEMIKLKTEAAQDREKGFTGDVCDTCGSSKMRRCGNCLTCMDCGANSGCG